MIQLIRSDECGYAIDPATAEKIVVRAIRYDHVHPATNSDQEFYVERIDRNGHVVSAAGFESEAQAFEHITGYPVEVTLSIFGKDVKRAGLGIPDGMVMRSPYSIQSEKAATAAREQADRDKIAADQQRQADLQAAVSAHMSRSFSESATEPTNTTVPDVNTSVNPATDAKSDAVLSTGKGTTKPA